MFILRYTLGPLDNALESNATVNWQLTSVFQAKKQSNGYKILWKEYTISI